MSNLYSKIHFISILNTVLRLIYVFFLAKILGSELYGLLAYGQSWYLALLPFAALGLGSVLSISVGRKDESSKETTELVLAARIISISTLAFVSFILAFVYEADSQTFTLLCIFSIALIGKGASSWAVTMFQAYERSKNILKMEKRFRPIELICGLCVAYFTENIIYIAANHSFFMCAQGVYSIALVKAKIGSIKPNWNMKLITSMVYSVLPLALASPFSQFLLQGPILLLKSFGGSLTMVGNLALSMQGFVILNLLFSSVGTAVVPVLSRANKKDERNIEVYTRHAIKITVVLGVCTALVGAIFAKNIILFIFPEGFELAANYIGILLLALVPAIGKNLLRSVLITRKKFKTILFADTVGVLALFLCCYYMIQDLQYLGIIIAILAGYSSSAFIVFIAVLRVQKIKVRGDISIQLISLVLVLILYFGLLSNFEIREAALVTFTVYLIVLFVCKIITWEEIEIASRIIRRKSK